MDHEKMLGVEEKSSLPEKEALGPADIRSMVHVVRGKQVMLDSDLAMWYGVATKNLTRAMRWNEKRFPQSFCFQLEREEYYEILRFQSGTLELEQGKYSKYAPFVYTEQGVAMLSAVLKSETAIEVSVQIMEAFVELRRFIANNAALFDRISSMELKQLEYQKQSDEKFEQIFEYIGAHEEAPQKLFFKGQIYDAFSFLVELIQSAERSIVLVDGYVDVDTLNLLAKKQKGVSVELFTLPKTALTAKDIDKFNAQYPRLTVRKTSVFHDRFLILDEERVYHVGASLKDAGKKCFGVSLLEEETLKKALLNRLEGLMK